MHQQEIRDQLFLKDENIILEIKVDKNYYHPGEIVTGKIYLQTKKLTNDYNKLILCLVGQQAVSGCLGLRNQYMNFSFKTYKCNMLMAEFQNIIRPNSMLIPFKFKLPQMITGSLEIDSQNHIKYYLVANLTHFSKILLSQIINKQIKIIQNPRAPNSDISLTNIFRVKLFKKLSLCNCFSYEKSLLKIQCNKNYAQVGDKIHIKCIIDSTDNSQRIKSSIKLVQVVSKAYIGLSASSIQNQYLIADIPNVKANQYKEFQVIYTIPHQINQTTAIGKYISRYYLLKLQAKCGFFNGCTLPLHIFIHSQKQEISYDDRKILFSRNPKLMSEKAFMNLEQFKFEPNKYLVFQNLPINPHRQIDLDDNLQNNTLYEYNYQNIMTQEQFQGIQPKFQLQQETLQRNQLKQSLISQKQ